MTLQHGYWNWAGIKCFWTFCVILWDFLLVIEKILCTIFVAKIADNVSFAKRMM